MTWEIVLGIIALLGFVGTIVKTVVPLTNAVTLLTEKLNAITQTTEVLSMKNTESHRRIWAHNDEQDETLKNHGERIHELEWGRGRGAEQEER